MLYHRYELGADGEITDAKIVPPTSQNQARSRRTCASSCSPASSSTTSACARRCEQAIRNYDPCISCATHFLRLEVDRG